MRIIVSLALAFTTTISPLLGQSTPRKPLTHDVYDSWKRIAREAISNSGRWVLYSLEPQAGDSRLIIQRLADGKADTIQRGDGGKFSYDSRFAAFFVKAPYADTKKAKIDKKKADEMPKDSLGIVRLDSPGVVVIPRVKSFKLPEKGSGWIAYQLEKEATRADTAKKGRGKDDAWNDQATDEKDKKEEKGTAVVVRSLEMGNEYRFPFTGEFEFTKNGSRILMSSTGNDSTSAAGVFVFDTERRTIDTLAIGRGKYKQIAWDDEGTQAAFVADRDTSKSKQRFFTLYYWTIGQDSATSLADTTTPGMRKRWFISDNGDVKFSKNGKKIFFGTAPIPLPEDTTFNDEETAKLDVWNWQDEILQSQQVKELETEKKRTYLAVIQPQAKAMVQLADPDVPTVVTGDEGNAEVAVGITNVPYRKRISWEAIGRNDVYRISVVDGARTRILEDLMGTPSLSPRARYITWFEMKQRHWFSLDLRTLRKEKVTSSIKVPLYDEMHDHPDEPDPYGALGWTANDSTFLVYDRFDVWSTDPTGTQPSINLTGGEGRRTTTEFRYVRLDPEERFLTPGNTLYFETLNRKDKSAGYASLVLGNDAQPAIHMTGPYSLDNLRKARNDSLFLYLRSSFRECPDLYLDSPRFTTTRRLSDANPQQKEYLWGTAELISWRAADGKTLEGLLYKPDNFDPSKKYPMLVYYYERNSDYLHSYVAPSPSRSTLNRSFCVSNGYVFFVPDIAYRVGHPGQSAYDAIVPGVKKIVGMGFVDPKRVGIQGQSWGGYQTAFLVTRTNTFRAAMAGAPVSNMTSAYGGIRWESGLVRMFQYEQDQSRIGGTLWEKLPLYLENSPLFHAPNVQTPLLIMHNDNDGAVPWYQGIELFTALRRLGKPAWMLTYNNEAHNLTMRKNMKDLSIRMMQFFDHYLKDAPLPVWMAKGIPAINKGKVMGYEAAREN